MTDDADGPIGHLQRRKIESRVPSPFIEACRTSASWSVATTISR